MSSFSDQSKDYLKELVRIALNSPKSIGYEKITVDSTIKNLTVPAGATYAIITLESADTTGIAARFLQTKLPAVQTTVGMPLYNGTTKDILDYQNLVNFQIIRVQSGATSLNVEYFR